MAQTTQRTKIVGNPGRKVFGVGRPATKKKYRHRSANPGNIIGFTLGNPGRKAGGHMAATKKRSAKRSAARGYSKSKYKKNPGSRKSHHHITTKRRYHHRRNPGGGMGAGLGPAVTNAAFVIVGALGSKLGAQIILGANNTGLIGYATNAAVGTGLWFATAKLMRNPAASAGVIAGTIVQILLRVINDYTPFGQYVSQLGMGDYQMQSFVTPQVLVDPWNSAEVAIPNGWAPRLLPPPPAANGGPAAAAAAAAVAAGNGGGMGGLYGGGWGGLYAA
jgi:hypothetical protein